MQTLISILGVACVKIEPMQETITGYLPVSLVTHHHLAMLCLFACFCNIST